MTEGGQTICLCMIVRDEAHVIERCLESVRPFIDTYRVCDTGSVDNTRDIIDNYSTTQNLPGTTYGRPWVDFAHNRNEALQYAQRSGADFALIIDADDWLTAPPGYRLPALTEDAYWLNVEHSNITYSRPQLVRLGRGCRWRGALHEFLEVPEDCSRGWLPLTVHYGGDGARSRNADKYRRDAEVLDRALSSGQDPDLHPRYTFYLAQSYRDAGELELARDWYQDRTALGGWVEEVYVSHYRAGQLCAQLGGTEAEVLFQWGQANRLLPSRLEALVAMARWLRERGSYQSAHGAVQDWYARYGAPLQPPSALFAEPWIYRYGFWDELSLAAYYTGQYRQALDAALQALKGDPPPADRERIVKNAEFALARL